MNFRVGFFFLILATITLGGCSDLGEVLKPRPQSQLSATALDFGTVAVSQSTTRSLTISNSGTGILTGTASISCSEYSLQSGGGSFTLAGGQSRAIVVEFTPGSVGSFPCTLDLGPNAPAVTIAGAAALQLPGAVCIVLQSSLAFGSVQSGQTSLMTTEVLNTGTASLLVNVVSGCGEFQVFRGGGTSQIPPGSSLAVTIAYSPLTSGRVSCVVEVGPNCPTIDLSGTGITVSFANDVRPILNARCISCHGYLGDPNVHIYLTLPDIIIGGPLVRPFEPDNSYFYRKLTPTPLSGSRMPYGGPYLSDTQIDLVRRWVAEGALDN